ncbi:hypothetical protein WJX84_006459 [Apatococcus fuscideae]|uniref:Uncharacterized protein n=1 Tax=Apatococcus fuscideae TaxID=2026836 RepID=A0AAW1RG21_9CHLO
MQISVLSNLGIHSPFRSPFQQSYVWHATPMMPGQMHQQPLGVPSRIFRRETPRKIQQDPSKSFFEAVGL